MKLSKNGKLNFYRKKRYPDGVLLTTDFGTWVYLANQEYRQFVSGEVSERIFKILEDKGIIVTEKNQDHLSSRYLDYQTSMFRGTSLHIIVPTIRCNQTCVYCYALRKPLTEKNVDMDLKTAKALVDFIFKTPSPVMTIEFTGGEPLLNFPVIKFIVEYARELNNKLSEDKKKDLLFSIVTNATLLNEEIFEFLLAPDIGVCISLDGPKELHNKHRKYLDGSPTFDKVEYWAKRFKAIDPNKANILPVVTKETMKYPKEIVDTYVRLGFTSLRLKYTACFGFAKETWNQIGYTPKEFLSFWKTSLKYMLELNKKGIKIREGLTSILLKKILLEENPMFAEMNAPCGAVTGQMVYNYNGDVYPCDESRIFPEFKLGNVKENSYKEVISHPTTCSLINISSNLSLVCDNCPYFAYCGLCPVHSFSMTGSIVPKLPFDIKCKMHKAMIDHLFELILFHPEERKILESWLIPQGNDG